MQHRSMRRNSSKMRDSKPSHIWCRIFSVLIQIWTEKVWDESLMIQTFDPMNWRYTLWSWLPILNSQPYGKMADSPRMTMRHLSTLWEISRPCSPNTFVSIVCIEIFRAMRSSQARRSRIWDRSRIYVCVLSENTLMTSQPERYERKEIIQKMRFLTCMNMRPQDDENIFFSILIPRIGRFSHFFDSVSRVNILPENITSYRNSRMRRSYVNFIHSEISSRSVNAGMAQDNTWGSENALWLTRKHSYESGILPSLASRLLLESEYENTIEKCDTHSKESTWWKYFTHKNTFGEYLTSGNKSHTFFSCIPHNI